MNVSKEDDRILMSACSVGDCTGLIPSGIESDEEIEAYNEICDFLPEPVSKNKNEKTKNHTN